MNITYHYYKHELWNRLIAEAKSKENNREIGLLSYVLSEVDLELSENILEKLNQPSQMLDLSTQSWQVIVVDKDVEISFLADDKNSDYKANINREIFKKAITEWHKFLQSEDVIEVTIALD